MNSKSLILWLVLAFIVTNASTTRADISTKQARSLITKAGGMSLPSSSVRVNRIEMPTAESAEATADVQLVFRVARTASGAWRISELRVGQDRWENLAMMARAAGVELPSGTCRVRDQFAQETSDLSNRRARCLVAELFAVELPSDAVRIKSISGMGVPLASEESVIVVSVVRLDFRFGRGAKGWQVQEFRSGSRNWTNIETIAEAISVAKRDSALNEMKTLARALEAFRRERGSFVVTDKHPALIDHLSPRYLGRVIRVDPWRNPYHYEGERDRFTLRSAGPDGKLNTADDVVLSGP
jgi:type II secretion system (T2SS) protein G